MPAPNAKRRTAPLIAILTVAGIVSAPIIAALWGAGAAERSLFDIFSGPGARYAAGTAMLCVLVGIGASLIGAGAAFAISLAEFPGRRIFAVLLALPFAIPAYIAAYAYGDFLGPFGPVAGVIGAGNLPEIRSLPGAAFVLSLSVYPYIYLALTAALAARSSAFIEAARALGASPITAIRRVLFSVSRPAIAGGLALALMETAAEYGVADYFGVPTLSVGIFRTWYGLGDLGAATQLAALLFFAALVFVLLEEAGRQGRVGEASFARKKQSRMTLSAGHTMLVIFFVSLPVILGFLLPAGVLLSKLNMELSLGAARGLQDALANTAYVAAVGAVLAIIVALALAYAARASRGRGAKIALRLATLGYAVPGAVIAIGILALTAALSRGIGAGAAGGVAVLIYAYGARFMTAAYNAIAGGLAQTSPQMDAAAKTLGANAGRIITAIHWPQIRGAALAGGAIVAIDIAKELPATLLLRPFNFETLATRVYRLASDERLADAAPAALLLIALGLIPVLIISSTVFGESNRDKQTAVRPGIDPDSGPATRFAGSPDPEALR